MPKKQDDFDPREVILMSLDRLDLAGEGLRDDGGHRLAGNIPRGVFDAAAVELRLIGMAAFTGGSYVLTEKGRAFCDQRFSVQPLKDDLFTCERKTNSEALPLMGSSLSDEIKRSRRLMKIVEWCCGAALVLFFVGILIYAQTH